VPATAADAKGLLRTAIRGDDPVLFFEHKMLYATKGEVPHDPDFVVPFGRAQISRAGKDVTIVAIGGMLPKALEAAGILAGEGIEAEVVDPRTLVPLDKETIVASVKKTSRVVVAHEAHKRLGPGAEIAALIAEEAIGYLDGPIVRVAARNVPLPYSPDLENYVLPSCEDIVEKARALVRGQI